MGRLGINVIFVLGFLSKSKICIIICSFVGVISVFGCVSKVMITLDCDGLKVFRCCFFDKLFEVHVV